MLIFLSEITEHGLSIDKAPICVHCVIVEFYLNWFQLVLLSFMYTKTSFCVLKNETVSGILFGLIFSRMKNVYART